MKRIGDYTEEQVLQLAASIESGSEHPLAAAILAAAEQSQIKLEKVKQFTAVAGHGVMATINERRVLFGNKALMDEQGVSITRFNNRLEKLSALGQTPMLLAVDNKIAGIIAVSDPIKKDSAQCSTTTEKSGCAHHHGDRGQSNNRSCHCQSGGHF